MRGTLVVVRTHSGVIQFVVVVTISRVLFCRFAAAVPSWYMSAKMSINSSFTFSQSQLHFLSMLADILILDLFFYFIFVSWNLSELSLLLLYFSVSKWFRVWNLYSGRLFLFESGLPCCCSSECLLLLFFRMFLAIVLQNVSCSCSLECFLLLFFRMPYALVLQIVSDLKISQWIIHGNIKSLKQPVFIHSLFRSAT